MLSFEMGGVRASTPNWSIWILLECFLELLCGSMFGLSFGLTKEKSLMG